MEIIPGGIDEFAPTEIGKVKDIERLKKILLLLIGNLSDIKYKTELIKLAFILDYLYCKKFGTREGPTTVEYIKYNYGPYSDKFIQAFNELVEQGALIEITLPFGIGYDLKEKTNVTFEDSVKNILKEVIEAFGKKSLKELKAFIYEKDEFKNAKFGEPIIFN